MDNEYGWERMGEKILGPDSFFSRTTKIQSPQNGEKIGEKRGD